MKLSLYQIEKDYITLAENLIDADGEVTDETFTALQINKEQLETKGQCYGFIVKELSGEIDIIEAEIKRLTALKSSRDKTIDRLKETLSNAMELFEIEEIKSPLMKISFRKSESIEIENEFLLDEEYVTEKITIVPDKARIKEAIKKGEFVCGAILKQNKNLQIK